MIDEGIEKSNQMMSSSLIEFGSKNLRSKSLRARAALMPPQNDKEVKYTQLAPQYHDLAKSTFFNVGIERAADGPLNASHVSSTHDDTTIDENVSNISSPSPLPKRKKLLGRRMRSEQEPDITSDHIRIYELCKAFQCQMSISDSAARSRHLNALAEHLRNEELFEPKDYHMFASDQTALIQHR